MNKRPLVSIILPTYNRASILRACIDSVLNQTYTNLELIVVDDFSKDNTRDILLEYMKKTKKIRGQSNSVNVGSSITRNIGIKMATLADLVMIIEDDLVLHPDCVEKLVATYNTLAEQGIDAVLIPRLIENTPPDKEAVMRNVPFYIDKLTGEIFNNYGLDVGELTEVEIGHACCLYSKKKLDSMGGYPEGTYTGTRCREESDVNMRLAKIGCRFFFQPNALADHNRISTGGNRMYGRVKKFCDYSRNHIVYLLRIYRIKSLYMIPCFLCKLGVKTVVNNL